MYNLWTNLNSKLLILKNIYKRLDTSNSRMDYGVVFNYMFCCLLFHNVKTDIDQTTKSSTV